LDPSSAKKDLGPFHYSEIPRDIFHFTGPMIRIQEAS
jgi:hypothetical protein